MESGKNIWLKWTNNDKLLENTEFKDMARGEGFLGGFCDFLDFGK